MNEPRQRYEAARATLTSPLMTHAERAAAHEIDIYVSALEAALAEMQPHIRNARKTGTFLALMVQRLGGEVVIAPDELKGGGRLQMAVNINNLNEDDENAHIVVKRLPPELPLVVQ